MSKNTPPDGQRLSQAQRSEQAKKLIIDAAIRIVSKHGVQGLTLAAAGEEAGYSRGIASHHFKKKDALLIAISEHITVNFREFMFGAVSEPGLDWVLKTMELFIEGVKIQLDGMLALHLILTEAVNNQELNDRLVALNEATIRIFQAQIELGMKEGNIRPGIKARVKAILILSSLRGLMIQYFLTGVSMDLTELRKALVEDVRRDLSPE